MWDWLNWPAFLALLLRREMILLLAAAAMFGCVTWAALRSAWLCPPTRWLAMLLSAALAGVLAASAWGHGLST